MNGRTQDPQTEEVIPWAGSRCEDVVANGLREADGEG